jgi:hypothetical protein
MIDTLNDLIHYNDDKKLTTKTIDQDKLFNFFYWDTQCQQDNSFFNFRREEKFERIFMVLDLLTRAMESDLAMFVIKYSHNLHDSITNSNSPLIRTLFWETEAVLTINSSVKEIISNLVKIIGLKYPASKIQILSRLVNLVIQTVNLNDYAGENFEYPKYSSTTSSIADEIFKAVETSVHYNLDLVLRVADTIQSHLIRMLFIKKILESIHKTTFSISFAVPYDLIRNKSFAKFKMEEPFDVHTANNEKYPVYNARLKSNCFETTQSQYLELLRKLTEAFDGFYHVKESLTEITNPKKDTNKITEQSSKPFDKKYFLDDLKNINLDEKITLRTVDLKYKTHSHIDMSMKTLDFYRNEFTNLLKISKLIQQCHQKLPGKFDAWNNFFRDIKA